MESLSTGLPTVCLPFFADQQVNGRYTCKERGVGMEIDNNVKRDSSFSLGGVCAEPEICFKVK
jgi:UDP:flavonoid glycosyltransferase YjiC (YdhE family)